MRSPRKPWQHDFQIQSEDELRILIHSLGWEINRPERDYGEDFYVQVFKEGNPSREVFYIQIKGTNDPTQYALQSGNLSYAIDVANLKQWYTYLLPVILILWDITKHFGYWIHIQPFIASTLNVNPTWLDNLDGKRKVQIPISQTFSSLNTHLLIQTIETEIETLVLARQRLEENQQQRITEIDKRLPISQDMGILGGNHSIPAQAKQQLQLAQYEVMLSADPSNTDALIGKAEIYYQLHAMDNALIAVNKLWILGRRDPKAAWLRGCIFTEYAIINNNKPQRMLFEAIDLFNSASLTVPSGPLNYNIGNALSSLGKYEEAIERYDQALLTNPPKHLAAEIWKNRGTAYFYLNNHDEEIRSYKKALAEDPNLWEAYSSWAMTELHLGHLSEAGELLSNTFNINPGLRETNFALSYTFAHTLWKTGRIIEAYQWVNQVLHVKPNHTDANKLKALLLADLWRKQPVYRLAAIPFFKNLLIDDPSNVLAQTELILLNNGEGFNDEVQALLSDEMVLESVSPDLLYDCAMMLVKEGETSRAIVFLEIAFKRNQKHHIVHKLAQLKMDIGDYRKAIELFKLASHDVKNPQPIWRKIADCYFFLKEYEICTAFMVKFILLEPRNHTWWINLAYALNSLGKAEIVISFRKLLITLESQKEISDIEIQESIDSLFDKLRIEFGEDFVSRIMNDETTFF